MLIFKRLFTYQSDKFLLLRLVLLGCGMLLFTGCYHVWKPLPPGSECRSEWLPPGNPAFLSDLTGVAATNQQIRIMQQEIFDTTLKMIAAAEHLIVLDMFLFNSFGNHKNPPYRKVSQELVTALVAKKTNNPNIRVVFITDPANTIYGGWQNPHLQQLEAAGVEVIITDVTQLRDSNPAWSSFWRIFVAPWGNSCCRGFMPNPFDKGKITLRSWLTLLNLKANHRKVVVSDGNGVLHALVSSANPHDGSSAHSNTGIILQGFAAQVLLESEEAVALMGNNHYLPLNGEYVDMLAATGSQPTSSELVQVVTEGVIGEVAEEMINRAAQGDCLDLIMFYLADRRIVQALKQAHLRGAVLRILLDPSKDAFGLEKNGMPNRQVAKELCALGIPLRWALTHGEQMHTKMLIAHYQNHSSQVLLGSANFTRRNLRNYNLETNIRLQGNNSTPVISAAAAYMDRAWENRDGWHISVEYERFTDKTRWRTWLYRMQEFTGFSTW